MLILWVTLVLKVIMSRLVTWCQRVQGKYKKDKGGTIKLYLNLFVYSQKFKIRYKTIFSNKSYAEPPSVHQNLLQFPTIRVQGSIKNSIICHIEKTMSTTSLLVGSKIRKPPVRVPLLNFH